MLVLFVVLVVVMVYYDGSGASDVGVDCSRGVDGGDIVDSGCGGVGVRSGNGGDGCNDGGGGN